MKTVMAKTKTSAKEKNTIKKTNKKKKSRGWGDNIILR